MSTGSETEEVSDSRSRQRYVTTAPLPADFSGYPVLILNLAEQGMQLEHTTPFKPGLRGRIRVTLPPENRTAEFSGVVVWSRLSKTPDAQGKYLYRSGLRIDELEDHGMEAMQHLITMYAHPEVGALERKRQALLARARSISHRSNVKVVQQQGPSIPDDVILLIQQIIERLRRNPDEASKWYNRAKYSVAQKEDGSAEDLSFHYRNDVLAVWEYLERTIDVNVISKVFEMRR